MTSSALGIFDSGIGGLTVMQEIKRRLPYEKLLYFGDTARVPYGNKSSETIIRYSLENAVFLLEKQIKLLVVACNTCNAFAMPLIRKLSNVPVIGVIEPGAEKAVKVTRNQHIAVIGTKATIESGAYQKAIHELLPTAEVTALACPLFVPFVEEGFIYHPATRLIIQEYLNPLKNSNIDTLLLGCTHYPFLKHLIEDEMGSNVVIVDSATTCAEQIANELKRLCKPIIEGKVTKPTHQYYVSDDPEKFRKQAENLFGYSLANVIHHIDCKPLSSYSGDYI